MLLISFLLCSLLSLASAQSSSSNAGAVFTYTDGNQDYAQITFALNADSSTGDLYFHLSSPSGNAWIGIGIGERMKDALMFVAYSSSNGSGVTVSPRIASGLSEPTYQSDITIDKIYGGNLVNANTRDNDNITVDAVCKSCAKWNGGAIDLTSKTQPFIFAVGPPFWQAMQSDSMSAGMQMHIFHGSFTMDMTAATSSSGGSVPLGPYTSKDASSATSTKFDSNPAPHIHGLVMCVVFVLILPFGSLILRTWNKVKGHAIVQTIGLVLFCMAFAGGCVVSMQYNQSKNFNSAHQVIGILLLLAFLSQFVLGFMHHRIYKREQRPTLLGKVHLYLGPGIIFFGLINGVIGFAFAGTYALPSTPLHFLTHRVQASSS